MDEQQKQTILDLPKVIAVGIASPVATLLTSRFGVAGTLIGLALSAIILTALADFLKVYLARAPAKVAKVPGGLRTRLSWRNIRGRLRAAFARFSYLPPAPARRRSILIGSVVAAGISFLVGLSAVTALELGVDKSLSCWVWDDCPTESSTGGVRTSVTSMLPSALGGGQDVSSDASEVQPSSPQQPNFASPEQPTTGAPGSSSQPEGIPDSEQQPDSPQSGQRWSPSGTPEDAEQRPSSSEASEEDERRSPVDSSEEDQQQEYQRQEDQPSSGSDQEASEPPIPWVPWST